MNGPMCLYIRLYGKKCLEFQLLKHYHMDYHVYANNVGGIPEIINGKNGVLTMKVILKELLKL